MIRTRTIFLAAALLTALNVAANAGGLERSGRVKAADQPYLAPVSATSTAPWSGCYVGGNLGYVVQTQRAVDDIGAFKFDVSTAADGFTYGIAGGCDLQMGSSPFVIGAMTDYDWTNSRDKIVFNTTGGGPTVVGDITIDNTWFVGGRFGILVTPRVLIYGVGGYTYVYSSTVLDPTGPAAGVSSDGGGITAGAGIEALAASGWSAKFEYRFVDLDNDTIKWDTPIDSVAKVNNNLHQVRLGVTYRFGGQ